MAEDKKAQQSQRELGRALRWGGGHGVRLDAPGGGSLMTSQQEAEADEGVSVQTHGGRNSSRQRERILSPGHVWEPTKRGAGEEVGELMRKITQGLGDHHRAPSFYSGEEENP